jgi:hypothetical protein
MKKPPDERLRKQADRQRDYRKKMKQERAPSRDDIARALLHFAVTENLKRDREAELHRLMDHVVDILEEQGFNRRKADEAFDSLVDRYENGWGFRRRLFLEKSWEEEQEGQ